MYWINDRDGWFLRLCWALIERSTFGNTNLETLDSSSILLLPESVSSCFSFCSWMKIGGEGDEDMPGEGEETGVVVDEDDGHGLGGNVLLFSNTCG